MTLKQALWEIVRDENIIITNQNIDWLLDRALKRASGDAQALKESILERKGVIEENIPCALTNEEKVSENGKLLLITENKSNNFDVKSNEELFKQALVEGLNRRFDREIEEAKKIEQIEEMAKILCGMKNGCDGCMWDKVHCNERNYAEEIYNSGYRKQSEGEWIKHCNTYECSVCKEELFIEYAEDYDAIADWNLHFCPNCGAKMTRKEDEGK